MKTEPEMIAPLYCTPANAPMYRAAPELLAALKALLKECEKIEEARCQTFFWCDEARAAIAKAEGDAP